MDRVHFVTHRGFQVLRVDFTGLRHLRSLLKVAEEARRRVESAPPGSVLVLVDLTGVPFSLRGLRELGEIAIRNAPYVRARAIVGTPEVADTFLAAIAEASSRPVRRFSEEPPALDWLVTQG